MNCNLSVWLVPLALALLGCSSKPENIVIDAYPVIKIVARDTSYFQDYVADIQAVQKIEVRARVSSFMESILVDEGQQVNKGQLLFTLSSQEYQQELNKAVAVKNNAQADVRAAEVKLENVKKLVAKNVISKTEQDVAQAELEALVADVEEAKARISGAELQLSFTKVRAPFSGQINRIPNKVGSLIDEGTLLTTLTDSREVFAYFPVSEKEWMEFQARADIHKNEVQLELINGTIHPYLGKIEAIEGEIDRSTGRIAFRARFPNPNGLLKHGSTGKVRLIANVQRALLVPQKATFELQDKVFVMAVDAANKVEMRNIEVAVRIPEYYIVKAGVREGDRLVLEGIQQLKSGDVITPSPVAFTPYQITR
ncbi:MAG: efflux RND transporter periplasmic adaptor subunit [Flammeovirgaceae bacterium]